MRARIVAGIIAAVVVAAVVVPLLAQARHIDPRDPNDTRGLLDVKRIRVSRLQTPRYKIITWSGWTVQRIWDQGFALVRLDTFGSSRFDYYALVRSTGARLVGAMFKDRKGRSDRRLFSVKTTKGSRRTFGVRIPLRKLRMPRQRRMYRWEVETLFVGGRCSRTCFDFVPNRGAFKERNPFAPPPTTTTLPPTTTTMPPTTTMSVTATTTPVTATTTPVTATTTPTTSTP